MHAIRQVRGVCQKKSLAAMRSGVRSPYAPPHFRRSARYALACSLYKPTSNRHFTDLAFRSEVLFCSHYWGCYRRGEGKGFPQSALREHRHLHSDSIDDAVATATDALPSLWRHLLLVISETKLNESFSRHAARPCFSICPQLWDNAITASITREVKIAQFGFGSIRSE